MKQQHGGDIYSHPKTIDFSSNINPLGTPKKVIEAAAKSLWEIEHYPDVYCRKLREELAKKEQVSPNQLIFGNGAAEVIFALSQALRPKKALLAVPTFLEYQQALHSVDCSCQYYLLKEQENFAVNKGFLDAIEDNIDMIFLCNPNNPTGQLIDTELMQAIMKKCFQKQIILVVDECFLDFAVDGEVYELKSYLPHYTNLFLLKAFTKAYGMAGIRLGYGLSANGQLLEKMESVLQPWNISIPAQAAGIAALKEREHVCQGVEIVRNQRPYLEQTLTQLGYKVYPGVANYIFFQGPENLYEKALDGGFLIRDCSNYPGLSKGYYRIAVKTKEENERLITWLKQL